MATTAAPKKRDLVARQPLIHVGERPDRVQYDLRVPDRSSYPVLSETLIPAGFLLSGGSFVLGGIEAYASDAFTALMAIGLGLLVMLLGLGSVALKPRRYVLLLGKNGLSVIAVRRAFLWRRHVPLSPSLRLVVRCRTDGGDVIALDLLAHIEGKKAVRLCSDLPYHLMMDLAQDLAGRVHRQLLLSDPTVEPPEIVDETELHQDRAARHDHDRQENEEAATDRRVTTTRRTRGVTIAVRPTGLWPILLRDGWFGRGWLLVLALSAAVAAILWHFADGGAWLFEAFGAFGGVILFGLGLFARDVNDATRQAHFDFSGGMARIATRSPFMSRYLELPVEELRMARWSLRRFKKAWVSVTLELVPHRSPPIQILTSTYDIRTLRHLERIVNAAIHDHQAMAMAKVRSPAEPGGVAARSADDG